MFIETDHKYGTGFEITEYKGTVRLVAAKQVGDKVHQKWGEIEIGKDKTKRLPVAVELGDKEFAVRTLKAVIEFIHAGKVETNDNSDVPF